MNTPTPFRRLASGVLALGICFGLIPAQSIQALRSTEGAELISELVAVTTLPDEDGNIVLSTNVEAQPVYTSTSSHWSTPYLERMVSYGFMRPEQAVDPTAALTRADFMSIVNRTFNYTEVGTSKFTDIATTDWFYEDVLIAANAGYISGTSATTASPNATLDRETVAFVLGKNLMLSDLYGENLSFVDGRDVSDWSRNMVKAASEYGIMVGYEDGTFRPQSQITFGEVAALILSAVGTPVLSGGEVTYGEVMGNVTITQAGTVLRDTVIAGDLFISNGIGLGDVTLENVTVLGRIVVCGGESQDGTPSIVLRHVKAQELIVDNLQNQIITLRVEGESYIENTTVSAPAYIEDNTTTSAGLRNITLDAESGTQLDLGGRIKTVTNVTPNSKIVVASGTVDTLNIDEHATNSTTEILRNAEVKNLNIDVATTVTGDGDIQNLVVNAPGAVVEQLPDTVEIRPGITANIAGEVVDSAGAQELSLDPLILSGYPIASNISPDNFTALFAVNKPGTLYWAISTISKGSVTEEDLITPPSYGGVAIQNGSLTVKNTTDDLSVAISELDIATNYYLSAVLVDGRGVASPVKVIAFATPDNTIPAFSDGFPYMSYVGATSASVTSMATKSCMLYFVVLAKGSQVPTPAEFLSGAISGSFGDGIYEVKKNTELTFPVSSSLLEEKDYDVHLWLTDADNTNYSEVVTLSFRTLDGTPPEFNQIPTVSLIKETSVSFTFNLNENGTVFYIAVPSGTLYPKLQQGTTSTTSTEPLNSEYAKLQVAMGSNGGTGSVAGSVAATKDTSGTFTINGLATESAYDLYYVARDTAGNYSVEVGKISFNTLDNTRPEFLFMEFTKFSDPDNPLDNPYATTDIKLTFSEGIKADGLTGGTGQSFLDLYNAVATAENEQAASDARDALAYALQHCFGFYQVISNASSHVEVRNAENPDGDDWTIDYRFVTVVTNSDGSQTFTFPTYDSADISALNLASGSTYYFELRNIVDASDNANGMIDSYMKLSEFTTAHAQVTIRDTLPSEGDTPYYRDEDGNPTSEAVEADRGFVVIPGSMEKVDDEVMYDIIFRPDLSVAFDLYFRVRDTKTNAVILPDSTSNTNLPYPDDPSYFTTKYSDEAQAFISNSLEVDGNGWVYLSQENIQYDSYVNSIYPPLIYGDSNKTKTASLNVDYLGYASQRFPSLNTLDENYKYEFVIKFTYFVNGTDSTAWNGDLDMDVRVYSGTQTALNDLSNNGTLTSQVSLISSPADYSITFSPRDSVAPSFYPPSVEPQDVTADMTLQLDRYGLVTYLIVPVTVYSDGQEVLNYSTTHRYEILDGTGAGTGTYTVGEITSPYVPSAERPFENNQVDPQPDLVTPVNTQILNYQEGNAAIFYGTKELTGGAEVIELANLTPETLYYAYFVVQGESSDPSEVYIYKFYTTEVKRPIITITNGQNPLVNTTTHVDSYLSYILVNQSAPIYETYGNSFTDAITNAGGAPTSYVTAFQASPYYSAANPMTVIQAMSTTYTSENFAGGVSDPLYTAAWQGYTVFDAYASTNLKDLMYEEVYNASQGNYMAGSAQDRQFFSSISQLLDHADSMGSDTLYTIFAIARNVNALATDLLYPNRVYSFAANDKVFKSDNAPPNIVSIISTYDYDISTTAAPGIEGTMTLIFDKYLYAGSSESGAADPLPVSVSTANSAAAGCFDFVSNLGGGVNTTVGYTGTAFNMVGAENQGTVASPIQSLTLTYQNAKVGQTFLIFSGNNRMATISKNYNDLIGVKLTGTLVETPKTLIEESQSGLIIETPYTEYTYTNLKWEWWNTQTGTEPN